MGGASLLGRLVGRLRPEPRGVGIEAENDLRLAFLDPRGEPCAEGIGGQEPFSVFFSPEPGVNLGTREAAIWIVSPVRGCTP